MGKPRLSDNRCLDIRVSTVVLTTHNLGLDVAEGDVHDVILQGVEVQVTRDALDVGGRCNVTIVTSQ